MEALDVELLVIKAVQGTSSVGEELKRGEEAGKRDNEIRIDPLQAAQRQDNTA